MSFLKCIYIKGQLMKTENKQNKPYAFKSTLGGATIYFYYDFLNEGGCPTIITEKEYNEYMSSNCDGNS